MTPGDRNFQDYEYTLPSGGILRSYVHDILNYRYNWHNRAYEIDILLTGKMEFVRMGEKYIMAPGDVILVNPSQGHTSLALEANTTALVLHFPSSVFREFLGGEQVVHFHFASDESTRDEARCRRLRALCTTILRAMVSRDICRDVTLTSAFDLLRVTLFTQFSPEIVDRWQPKGVAMDMDAVAGVMEHINENYSRKLSLEELADQFGYNRTYLSTFFKKNVGMGFYDYLTNVRFSHAVIDLITTKDSLTKVAMYNGFPDLKTFSKLFQDFFHLTPQEYRRSIPEHVVRTATGHSYVQRRFREPEDEVVREVLDRFSDFRL